MPQMPLAPALTPAALVDLARARYTAKAFDPARRVPDDTLDALLDVLRQSPSSVNSQPWHFVVAGTPEARARVAKGMSGKYGYNAPKVADASHVIVLCTRIDLPPAFLDTVLAQEAADGRFRDDEARATQAKTRGGYIDAHRYATKDLPQWIDKQAYLALGALLLGAAALGVDATPMEGFDAAALDAELGLHDKGLTSLVVVALGYRADGDFNARLPKSRLPLETVVTVL